MEHTIDQKQKSIWRRDPVATLTLAGIFLWGGLVSLGPALHLLGAASGRPDPWGIFFLGAGMLLILDGLIRVLAPSFRKPSGDIFLEAAVCVGIGTGFLGGWIFTLPVILISWAILILLHGISKRF